MNTSPRKVVPLAPAAELPASRSDGGGIAPISVTKRAFFCGVVVEGGAHEVIAQDVQDLVASLGSHISMDYKGESGNTSGPPLPSSASATSFLPQRKRSPTDSSALVDVINELVSTERSYVKRLRMLQQNYAIPLRSFARQKDTALLPAYEAKTMFGNIDQILATNDAFLADLEKMLTPQGPRLVGGIGDVTLKHFKELESFNCYKQYYSKREEAQAILEREMAKRSSTGFVAYIDRIKYSTNDSKNRIGLRELLMDPVQRIPRYTLLFRTMIKYMAPGDPQRAKLMEADEYASRIALCETDEQTKRAAVMYCLERTVEGFPPGLISNGRRFIDCIDVEDIPADSHPANISTSSGPPTVLHCTLFLFDDRLVIAKRPHAGSSGRVLAGLDQLERLAKTGGLPMGMKRSGMSCKGVVDIVDVTMTDIGGADIHLYLEAPPADQTERWSGRPFRALSTVLPPAPINLDPVATLAEKRRFLENFWRAQALFRTRNGRSVALCAEELEVEAKSSRRTIARTYFNVYQRTAYLGEQCKGKIVLHIDPSGIADPLPFGVGGGPFVILRAQPIPGELVRFSVTSSDPSDDDKEKEDIIHGRLLPTKVIQTIHQFGLFQFRTGRNSLPSTPMGSSRSKAAIFGLDAISRNLLNAIPGTVTKGSDGHSTVTGHKRTRSRASTYTSTITGTDSSYRFSQHSVSTGVTSYSDEDSFRSKQKEDVSRKLLKRPKSAISSTERELSQSPRRGRSQSPTTSRAGDTGTQKQYKEMDQSEWDLTLRLELARKNSRNQQGMGELTDHFSEAPVEETIYEEEPPARLPRPRSSERNGPPTQLRPDSTTPTQKDRPMSPFEDRPVPPSKDYPVSPSKDRPTSPSKERPVSSRKPRGPRRSSLGAPRTNLLETMDIELALEENLAYIPTGTSLEPSENQPITPPRSTSPQMTSRRRPFEPTGNEVTPKVVAPIKHSGSVEPLSIKKKTSTRSPSITRKSSFLGKGVGRTGSARRTSYQRVAERKFTAAKNSKHGLSERLIIVAEATKQDVDSSRRAVKRIKLEVDTLRSTVANQARFGGFHSPTGTAALPRSPPTWHIPNKAVEARMQEMREAIERRQASNDGSPRKNIFDSPVTPRKNGPGIIAESGGIDVSSLDQWTKTVDELVGETDNILNRAATSHDSLLLDINSLVSELKEKSMDLDRMKVELQSSKRQCELVKKLLNDAAAENEILFEAFNEELDGMFNDANLPETEAWTALTQDLRSSKESRNALKRENALLKQKLKQAEVQNEEWGALLKSHGLIP